MALTYTTIAKMNGGNFRTRVIDILADATYTASTGYTLAVADYSSLLGGPAEATTTAADSRIILFDAVTNPGGVQCCYDGTNRTLRFYEAGAESTTTISSKTVRVQIWHDPVNHK